MIAITARVIAAGVKYNMASQFRFGFRSYCNKSNNSPGENYPAASRMDRIVTQSLPEVYI
ncbi:hypothetical protein A4D02_17870 [Niastella koreensis]|uniref:Uncharacterized protein n=2 Tax=Niastella koreensis TaxID=354356 RepID=G8TBK9_NIAKG|nr:hypothetical protein Niako_0737 [Niastella koreensis GR20-10]OQP39194.1 hypothetical protein A4D02_17870 [Niastella koreensis]